MNVENHNDCVVMYNDDRPIPTLPNELTALVFESLEQSIKIKIARVSKVWNAFIYSPIFWKKVILYDASKFQTGTFERLKLVEELDARGSNLTDAFIKTLVTGSAGTTLKVLDISVNKITNVSILFIGLHCCNLMKIFIEAAAQSWEWDQYSDKSGYIDRLIILNGPNTLVWQNNAKERFKQVFHYNNLKTLINQPRQTLRNSWAILTPCIRQFCMSNYIFRFKIPYLPERLFVLKDVSAYDEFFKSMNNVSAEDIEMFKAAACMENYASIKGGMNYYRSNAMLGFYNEQEKRGIKQVGFIGIPTLVIWGEKDEFLESDLCLDNLSKHVSNLETLCIDTDDDLATPL
ncbi:5421_t:CDS:2, partial [Entrophospora sp. SA101]